MGARREGVQLRYRRGEKTLAELFDGHMRSLSVARAHRWRSSGPTSTYSAYDRGTEVLGGAYQLLDRVPKGRDEEGLPYPQAWIRRHDEYEEATTPATP